MKMNIAGYEVDIKAKRHEGRANKEELGYFLNYIALLAIEAKMKWRAEGYDGLSEEAGRWHNDIDEQLKSMGAFKN